MNSVHDQYTALTSTCGYVDFTGRTQIEFTGGDCVSFLNNLCTNDIPRVEVGGGCEAFVTTVQGKVLAHIFVFRTPTSLIVESARGQAETLLAHFDRYIITEDVRLTDRTPDWCQYLLTGPQASGRLQSLGFTERLENICQHHPFQTGAVQGWVRRVPFVQGEALMIVAPASESAALAAALQEAAAVECSEAAFHSVRIESGFPWFPLDITADNLPQEVARDSQAISFTKGCYLGQETVARLDALGHVNRILTGLRLNSHTLPAAGTELTDGDHTVGRITSAAISPKLDSAIALGYVRCVSAVPATQLQLDSGTAEVIRLPLDQ